MIVCALLTALGENPIVDLLSGKSGTSIANLFTIYQGVIAILTGSLGLLALKNRSKAKLIENLRKERDKRESVIADLQTELDEVKARLPETALDRARKEQVDNNYDLAQRAIADWMSENGESIAQMLFMRAEWTIARAAGELRAKGLVASHGYCVSASAFSTGLMEAVLLRKDAEAILRDTSGSLPPLTEALRDFDEEAKVYFAARYDQDAMDAAQVLIDEAIRRYEHENYHAALLAIQVAEIWIQANDGRQTIKMLGLLYWKSGILQKLGRYHEALHATEEAIRGYQGLPALDPTREWLYRNQIGAALILHNLGSYKEALREAQAALKAFTDNQDSGSEHQEALSCRRLVAQTLRRLGRYEEALHEAQAVLKAFTDNQGFGSEHQETLSSRYVVADILDDLGRYEEALREAQAVVRARTDNLNIGPVHSDTLANRHLVADILIHLGRYNEALHEAQAVVKAFTDNQDFGAEHPRTLASRFLMAQILGNLGRYEEALREAQAVVRARTDNLNIGPVHPDTLEAQVLVEKICEHMRSAHDDSGEL